MIDDQTEVRRAELERLERALGRLLIQANLFDEFLFEIIWLVSQQPLLEIVKVCQGHTTGGLIKEMDRIFTARVSDAGLLKRKLELDQPMKAALDARNEHIHAAWSVGMTAARLLPTGELVRGQSYVQRTRRPRNGPPHELITMMKVERIDAATELIGETASDLQDFEDAVFAVVGKLPPQVSAVVEDKR